MADIAQDRAYVAKELGIVSEGEYWKYRERIIKLHEVAEVG